MHLHDKIDAVLDTAIDSLVALIPDETVRSAVEDAIDSVGDASMWDLLCAAHNAAGTLGSLNLSRLWQDVMAYVGNDPESCDVPLIVALGVDGVTYHTGDVQTWRGASHVDFPWRGVAYAPVPSPSDGYATFVPWHALEGTDACSDWVSLDAAKEIVDVPVGAEFIGCRSGLAWFRTDAGIYGQSVATVS